MKVVLALLVVFAGTLLSPRATLSAGADVPVAPTDVRVVVDGMGRFRLEWRDNASRTASFDARVEILRADGAVLHTIAGAAADVRQPSAYIYMRPEVVRQGCYAARLSVAALASAGRRSAPAIAEAQACVDGKGALSFPAAGAPAYLPAAPAGLRVVSDPVAGPVLAWRDNSNDETYFDAVMRVVTPGGEVLARIDIAFTVANVTTMKLPPALDLPYLELTAGCYGAILAVHARGVDGAESHPAETSAAICFDSRGAMTFPDAPAPGPAPASPGDVRLEADGAGWYRIAWSDHSSDEARFDVEVRFETPGGVWAGTLPLAPIAANVTSAAMPRNNQAFGLNVCFIAVLRAFAVSNDGATSLPSERREAVCVDGAGGLTLPALGSGMDGGDVSRALAGGVVLTSAGLVLAGLGARMRTRARRDRSDALSTAR